MMYKSFRMRREDVVRQWIHLDANDVVLGKLATKVAMALMGKHRPTYTPDVDTGDFVVITNAEKVRVTGKKESSKVYRYHTGWMGGLKERTLGEVRATRPEDIISLAVRRMLPKSTLGKGMHLRLKVYAGAEHPHAAQNPTTVQLDS